MQIQGSKREIIFVALACIAAAFALSSAFAQGNFTNLNFESASLTPVPAGQYGGFVPASEAFPGWTVTDGYETLNVFQNNLSTGEAVVDILGPYWQPMGDVQIISGNYTAVLQSGEVTRGIVPAILEQTGQIPANANSLTFDAIGSTTGGYLTVGFNGQNISYFPLGPGPNGSEEYGADVSPYKEQTGQLSFSENPVGGKNFNDAILDNIQFSPNEVPEPCTWTLLMFGAGLLGGVRYANSRLKA